MLVLLASYPKSGNTWMRALLSNYFANATESAVEPVGINQLLGGTVLNERDAFDEELGLDSSVMTFDEIDNWRPDFGRALIKNVKETTFVKLHDAYTFNTWGKPLFPASVIQSAIYVVRNPLSVCISFAHFNSASFDATIRRMSNEKAALAGDPTRLHDSLRQRLLSWSNHVSSWLDQTSIPVELVRYEDLVADTAGCLSKLLNSVGENVDEDRVRIAVDASSFDNLKQQEAESEFREKPESATTFFRKGTVDEWKTELSDIQVSNIIASHGPMMKRLGYL